ncbi:MerR family transcriptional regulator, partial [Actinoplanes sp. NPDC051633]
GIKRIIALENMVGDMEQRVAELEAQLDEAYARIAQYEAMGAYPSRDLVRQERPSTALVVWRPRRPGS